MRMMEDRELDFVRNCLNFEEYTTRGIVEGGGYTTNSLAFLQSEFSKMVKDDTIGLHRVEKGKKVRLVEIPKGKSRIQMMRLGLIEGTVVRCLQRLPGGTIVIERHRQEIAIGAALAKEILVTEMET